MSNIPIIATFEKVSFEQFNKDYKANQANRTTEEVYEAIKLPVRSSIDSAGHDFVLTKEVNLKPGDTVIIETGIKAKIEPGWVLVMAPRSGLGFNFRMQLNNTIGIIDGDYYDNPKNEGHILVAITNDNKEGKSLVLEEGDRFVQGLFIPYGITTHDKPLGKRIGGQGSSGL